MRFLDRDAELAFLDRSERSRDAALVVLWGRRRVGKTALLRRFAERHRVLYHVASRATAQLELERLSARIAEHFDDPVVAAQPFSSWEVVWRYLATRSERVSLILDEFPYLAEADPAFTTLLQAAWDERLAARGVHLYLCGSSVAMVERLALSKSAPLFGRRTGQWRLEPLRPWDLAPEFGSSFVDLVRLHAVAGGVPYYLERFDASKSLGDNIRSQILEKGSALYEEVPFLLREELREPRVYFSILATIALGSHRFGEISSKTGLDRANISRYLAELEELGLVRRDVPVTERNPAKSRKGLYRVADPFTRFWFRFVYPHLDLLELGRASEVQDRHVTPAFEAFVSHAAEEAVRDLLCDTEERRHLPFEPVYRGRHWGPEAELDLVLMNGDRSRAFVGEVKWSARPVARALLDDLRARAGRVRELERAELCFGLISASGFSQPARKLAADERLIDLGRVRFSKRARSRKK